MVVGHKGWNELGLRGGNEVSLCFTDGWVLRLQRTARGFSIALWGGGAHYCLRKIKYHQT